MAQNKRNIKKPHPSEVKVSNPLLDKLQKEDERRQRRRQIFIMSKQTKNKIKAWIAAAAIMVGGIETARVAFASSNNDNYNTQKTFTIAIANDNAKISDRGQTYRIDSNSFVIVSKDEALAYDENGNIQKGQVSGGIKEVCTITEDEMSKYNIYQVTAQEGVNIRSTGTIEDNNIISTAGYQDYVLGYSTTTDEYDGEWVSTLSVSGDKIYEGYIREDLIQEVGNFNLIYDNANEILMKVDTLKDGNVNLNLRTRPEDLDKRFIMTTIPNGSIVRLIAQKTSENDEAWSHIEYKTSDGQKFQGWVLSDYLSVHYIPEQGQENTGNSHGGVINSTGNVTGIDVSAISPNELRQLLKNGIPDSVSTTYGRVDTTQFAGDINFVYIKLGASPYGNGEFKPLDYKSYKEQVQICEEMGIPYGFYYYSTCTTVKEANIELENITEKIRNLQEDVDMKNNKLEMVVDVELSGKNDRQYKGNIEEQTRAKASLINGIQEAGLSNSVLIYGPMRVMQPDLDQIFSLSDLRSMLSNPNDVNLWLCSPTNKDGNLSSGFEREKEYARQLGFDVVMSQIVLDGNVGGRIDINNMSFDHYQSLVGHINEITQSENTSNQINEHDER